MATSKEIFWLFNSSGQLVEGATITYKAVGGSTVLYTFTIKGASLNERSPGTYGNEILSQPVRSSTGSSDGNRSTTIAQNPMFSPLSKARSTPAMRSIFGGLPLGMTCGASFFCISIASDGGMSHGWRKSSFTAIPRIIVRIAYHVHGGIFRLVIAICQLL